MKNKILIYTIISLLILSNLVLAGIYIWQKRSFKTQALNLQQQINTLNSQLDQLQPQENTGADIVDQVSEFPEQLVTEREIGYIKRVYDTNGKRFLDIDYIQWLGVEECKTRGRLAPNGYCIENQNTKIRAFEISRNAQIKVDTLSHRADGNFNFGESISYETFKNLFAVDSNSLLKQSAYWINVENSIITSIAEQYQP